MAWKKTRLPREYQEVEYLESTGTQYIDTSTYVTSKNCSMKTKVYTPSMPGGEKDIASNYMLGDDGRIVLGLYENKVFAYAKTSNSSVGEPNAFSKVFYGVQTLTIEAIYNSLRTSKTLTVNGSEYSSIYTADPRNTSKTICLFRQGAGGNRFIGKMYYFEYSEDTIIKISLVPCYRKSDNKPGMYDLCGSICPLTNSAFYINAGSGEFLVGPDVN